MNDNIESPTGAARGLYGRFRPLLLQLLAFAVGAGAGYLYGARRGQDYEPEMRLKSEYKFISPLLECEHSEGRINVLIPNFKHDLRNLSDKSAGANGVSYAAVYFRDLSNGPWFGLNESERFRPASLLKVPVAMAVYHASERDPSLLKRKFRYDAPAPLPSGRRQMLPPSVSLQPGRDYTVESLVEQMLLRSDNQALLLLAKALPENHVRELYKVLGIDDEVMYKLEGTISLRSFGAFYRILYNSSYLSRENSERLLELLSRTEYVRGLVAGVPPLVSVAHKFGEGGDPDGTRQLQDCGIVYHPGRPYLLCVMAKGSSLEALEKYIAGVSAFVYGKVSSVAPAQGK